MIQIRRCTLDDLTSYADHSIFHMTEKGIDGVYAHPFPASHQWNRTEFIENLRKRWSSEPWSPNWEVSWVAIQEGRMVGHLNLSCGGIEATKHRMVLGMGVEAPYRSQGIGRRLLNDALTWTKEQRKVSWIDLGVFSKNTAAFKLYQSFGFEASATIIDAIRIGDESIDDIRMTLKL